MVFTPQELWASTGTPVRAVIFVMLLMAVWCIYVGIERIIALNRARSQSRALAADISGLLSKGDGRAALEVIKAEKYKASYLGHLLLAGLTEFVARSDRHGIEATGRALDRATIVEGADLKKGLNILATTGSTAPFVGLVGTIFGIINAFAGMAEAGGGGLAAISAGIAEALVTTAIGITVAIMGVWMYNYFNAQIDAITNDMNVSIQELLDWCEKQLLKVTDRDEEDTETAEARA